MFKEGDVENLVILPYAIIHKYDMRYTNMSNINISDADPLPSQVVADPKQNIHNIHRHMLAMSLVCTAPEMSLVCTLDWIPLVGSHV